MVAIRNWLLEQMNARDAMDGVAVTVKLAVREFGVPKVARKLRSLADHMERTGEVPGWQFPGRKRPPVPSR